MTILENVGSLAEMVGTEVAVSRTVDVAQARIDGFAEVTEDRQWIHTDPARAKTESLFGTTIAHGFLLLSLLPALMARALQIKGGFKSIVNCGLDEVRFRRPVPSDARVYARFRLKAFAPAPMGVEAVWSVDLGCEGDEKVYVQADWIVRYLR